MKMNIHSLRKEAFRLRGGIWGALFVLILAFASPTYKSILPGLFLVCAGQALRFWAVGCIVLYRGEKVKAKRLVTWGPYSLIRNPLYIANGLVGLGWAVMAGSVAILSFLLLFIVLYVWLIVPYEESFLRKTFSGDYIKYCSEVNAFFPKSWPLRIKKGPFNRSVLWSSERHSLWVTLTGTVLLLSRLWW